MKGEELTKKEQKKLFTKRTLSEKDIDMLYEMYHKKIYDFVLKRVSNPHIAEDLTSSIFEKILKSIKNFQWQGITVSAWIFRIARNRVIDHYRQSNKYKGSVSIDDVTNFVESKSKAAIEMLEDGEQQVSLYNAIREFKDEDQYLIYYKYFEDLSNKEIANLVHMTETNIGTRLHRIRKKLRKLLYNK